MGMVFYHFAILCYDYELLRVLFSYILSDLYSNVIFHYPHDAMRPTYSRRLLMSQLSFAS